MVKLIIFDLDGVLVDCKDLHYETLNQAINLFAPEFVISYEEHISSFDGLSTKNKLKKLCSRGLPEKYLNDIWLAKQKFTIISIEAFQHDNRIIGILEALSKQYQIVVASNSIRETVDKVLSKKGFSKYINFSFCNEDVSRAKPSAEIYMKCMLKCHCDPNETLIIEDSCVGRTSAINSGANVLSVKNSTDVSLGNILNKISQIDIMKKPKWDSKSTNILIPMAGEGSRFKQAGYTFPKPLIEVLGKPMIQLVTENLNIDGHFIFLARQEHIEKYNLNNFLNIITPNCDVVGVSSLTEGAACTTLLAESLIDNDNPLIIANSDQYIEFDSWDFMYSMESSGVDGGIITFNATHPKWSFAKINDNGLVTEVAEKNPISSIATVGIYYWKRGKDYVKYAKQMIAKNIRTNNEFYICPVFNEAIQDGKVIKNFQCSEMHGLGTPEDLNSFINKV